MQVYIPTLCQQTGCEWVYQMNGCPNTFPCRVSIHTFHNTESRTTIIYDWRASISSMFYGHELGNRTQNEHGADFATITLKYSTSSLFNTILVTILLVAYVLILYLHPRGYIHWSSKSSFCTDSRMLTFIYSIYNHLSPDWLYSTPSAYNIAVSSLMKANFLLTTIVANVNHSRD